MGFENAFLKITLQKWEVFWNTVGFFLPFTSNGDSGEFVKLAWSLCDQRGTTGYRVCLIMMEIGRMNTRPI